MVFAHARAAAAAVFSARRKSKIPPKAPARPERGGLEIEDTTCGYSIPVDAGEGRYRDGDRDTKVTGGSDRDARLSPKVFPASRLEFLRAAAATPQEDFASAGDSPDLGDGHARDSRR